MTHNNTQFAQPYLLMKQYTFLLEVSEKYVRDVVDRMVDVKNIKTKEDLKKIDAIIKRIRQHSMRSSARAFEKEPFNTAILDAATRNKTNSQNRDLMRRIAARLRTTRNQLSTKMSTEEAQKRAMEAKLKVKYNKLKKAGLIAAGMSFAAFCAYAYQKYNDKKYNKKS